MIFEYSLPYILDKKASIISGFKYPNDNMLQIKLIKKH